MQVWNNHHLKVFVVKIFNFFCNFWFCWVAIVNYATVTTYANITSFQWVFTFLGKIWSKTWKKSPKSRCALFEQDTVHLYIEDAALKFKNYLLVPLVSILKCLCSWSWFTAIETAIEIILAATLSKLDHHFSNRLIFRVNLKNKIFYFYAMGDMWLPKES